MKSITELNVAELLFEAGVARDEYKRAYKRMKDVEEELDRRSKYKIFNSWRCRLFNKISNHFIRDK